MKYNSEHYYRIAAGIMGIVLIPFIISNVIVSGNDDISFIIIMLAPLMMGWEYSYIFPRQAMKLYEEILYKSFIERVYGIIVFSIFIIFSVAESYYFITDNVIPILAFMMLYPIWAIIFKNQSVIIGSKNIIIGKYRIPYDLVQSVSLEKKTVLIKTDEQSFEISNWAIGKGRYKLEQVLKQINLTN